MLLSPPRLSEYFRPNHQSMTVFDLSGDEVYLSKSIPVIKSDHPQLILYTDRLLLPHLLHFPSLLPLELFGTNSVLTLNLQLVLAPFKSRVKTELYSVARPT